MLAELGRMEEAEGWYRRAADTGENEAVAALTELQEHASGPEQRR